MRNNVYILAMGRSGTTLLQNILDAHPSIVTPPESFFMLHLYHRYKDQKEWDDELINRFIEDVCTDRPFRIVWRVEKDELKAAILQYRVESFADACNAVRSSYQNSIFTKKQLKLFGDKNPVYSSFTDRIMKVHPNAKIIHVVRDPRGTANGHINTFKRKDALAIGLMWSYHNRNILKLKEKYPRNYYLLRYEELITSPDKVLKELCGFLGIPYIDSLLVDYRMNVQNRFDKYGDKLKEKHKNLLKPIDPLMVDKWRSTLRPRQIRQIEFTSSSLASKLGYEILRPRMSIEILLKWPFSRLKVMLALAVLKSYFFMPFRLRKWVLKQRSKKDYKYQS